MVSIIRPQHVWNIESSDNRESREAYETITMGLYYHLSREMTRTNTEAEELLSLTFLNGLERHSFIAYKPKLSKPKTFLKMLMKRTAIDELRRKKRGEIFFPDRIEPEEGIVTPYRESQDHREEMTTFEDLISFCKESLRPVLELKYVRGLTVEEISKYLNMPSGTVKSRLSRALKEFRRDWMLKRWIASP